MQEEPGQAGEDKGRASKRTGAGTRTEGRGHCGRHVRWYVKRVHHRENGRVGDGYEVGGLGGEARNKRRKEGTRKRNEAAKWKQGERGNVKKGGGSLGAQRQTRKGKWEKTGMSWTRPVGNEKGKGPEHDLVQVPPDMGVSGPTPSPPPPRPSQAILEWVKELYEEGETVGDFRGPPEQNRDVNVGRQASEGAWKRMGQCRK